MEPSRPHTIRSRRPRLLPAATLGAALLLLPAAAPAHAVTTTTSTDLPVAWVYSLLEDSNGDTRILERNGGGSPFLDIRVPAGGGEPVVTTLADDPAYAGGATGRLLPNGGAILALTASRHGHRTLEVIDRRGGASAPPVTLSAPGGAVSQPGLVASPSGAAAVSWVQRVGKRHRGYLALRGPGQGAFGAPIPVPGGGAGNEVAYGGTYNAAGDGAFFHYRAGRSPILTLARIGRDGRLGAPIVLQQQLGVVGLADAVGRDGTIAVVWVARHEPAPPTGAAFDVDLALLPPGAAAPTLRTLSTFASLPDWSSDFPGPDLDIAGGRVVVAAPAGGKNRAVRTWSLPLADPQAAPHTSEVDARGWIDRIVVLGHEDGTADLLTVAELDDAWGARLQRTPGAADGTWQRTSSLGFALSAGLAIDAAIARPGGGIAVVAYGEGSDALSEQLLATDE